MCDLFVFAFWSAVRKIPPYANCWRRQSIIPFYAHVFLIDDQCPRLAR